MSTPNETPNETPRDTESMRRLAQLLLEKTQQKRVRWTIYGAGEYTTQVEDLALKIHSDPTESRLRLIDQHARTAGDLTAATGTQGDAALLQEIQRLAAEQVQYRTMEQAMGYLQELDRQPTGSGPNSGGQSRPGPRPLAWLRARLGL